jgi:S-formylglutathione hydrolase
MKKPTLIVRTVAMGLAWFALVFIQALPIGVAEGQAPAATQVPAAKRMPSAGTVIESKVHSSALMGNLLKDSADRNVTVYLPPGYAKTAKRYPVIYLLHGYEDTNAGWTRGDWANVPKIFDRLISAGKIKSMIVVMPDGSNKFDGSFYTNSVTTGNWEDFVTQDLVKAIDTKYRTLARASARGIAGHSMGGYGALKLAMKHPEVYGAVYGMSACCMEWGEDLSLANPAWDKTLNFRGMEDFEAAHKVINSKASNQEQFVAFFSMAFVALSAAWSPNPQRPPFFADFPVEGHGSSRKPVEAIQAKWSANMVVPMAGRYRSNLLQLRGIAFDVGAQDEFAHIIAGARDFDKELSQNKITHEFETYQGNHGNKIGERLENKVFPFFSKMLQ